MYDLPELLFHEYKLREYFDNNMKQATKDIDAITEEQFVSSQDKELIEHVYSKRIVLLLEIHEDMQEMETKEIQVDVSRDRGRLIFDRDEPFMIPGIEIKVTIPFTGVSFLFKCQPSTSTFNPPRANIHSSSNEENGLLEIIITRPADHIDDKEIKTEIGNTISEIKRYINWINYDIELHNQVLLSHIREYVTNRRNRLGKHQSIIKALNIPLKKKRGAPDVENLPIKRKIIRPLPSAPRKPPEPGISDEDYNHILSVIRHEGRSFETTPATFSMHDEEELRDIILAHLNGHYQCQATGETFRKSGKTDIRIEAENRSAFIAECKIWRGQSEISEAIDQLLGYLTWRDCKTALVVFNVKNAKFSELQSKLPEAIEKHDKFIRKINIDESSEWRFEMKSKDDEDRTIVMHVFLINLYVNN